MKTFQGMINGKSFALKVDEMREAQREYFTTRRKRALFKAKELEKEVDEELKKIFIKT